MFKEAKKQLNRPYSIFFTPCVWGFIRPKEQRVFKETKSNLIGRTSFFRALGLGV